MARNIVKFSSFIIAVLFCGGAWGQDKPQPGAGEDVGNELPIDVMGRSVREKIKIAVPDTRGMSEIAEIIRFDLQMAGAFKVLPTDSFFFDQSAEGATASTINFQNWFNVGASGLIKSAVKEEGDQVTPDLRLFLVDRGEQVKLKWAPRTVPKSELRKEVHAFVNAVLEYYTGIKGPFGTAIAFAAATRAGEKHVYTMEMDGSSVARISKNSSINILPAWGGGGVYFTSYQDGNPNLYLGGGGAMKLISDRPGLNASPAYCGGKLVVTLSQGGSNVDLYLLDGGSGAIIRRLTDHWSIDTSPSFSPDCSQIAFVSDRAGGPQIFVMPAGGGAARQVTHAGRYNSTPSWSPKGDQIAFTGVDEGGGSDIFTVDLGGAITRLTQNQGRNEEPSWSPDGNYLVFVSTRGGGGSRLYIMTADGETQTLITKNGSGYATPRWAQ